AAVVVVVMIMRMIGRMVVGMGIGRMRNVPPVSRMGVVLVVLVRRIVGMGVWVLVGMGIGRMRNVSPVSRMGIVLVVLVRRIVGEGVLVRLVGVRPFDRPAAFEDPETGAGHAAPQRLAALDGNAGQTEPGDGFSEQIERHAEIETGAEKHVAGKAARAIKMVVRHGARVSLVAEPKSALTPDPSPSSPRPSPGEGRKAKEQTTRLLASAGLPSPGLTVSHN